MPGNWTFADVDRMLAAELQSFLPQRIFDVHAHLYRAEWANIPSPNLLTEGPGGADVATWRQHLALQVGDGRLAGGLFMPYPILRPEHIDDENRWLLGQVAAEAASRGLIVVAPDSSQAQVETLLQHPGCAGFKPYHTHSSERPTMHASLASFLPEWVWQLADAHRLVITLHMVKALALADPDNQREIAAMCRRYPGAKLILAHAARGFHAPNTVKGLAALRGIDNVWFDTSGVCEATALTAIVREFGPRRLLFGSDFPVSQIRGKCVTVGDGFLWLYPQTLDWDEASSLCHPALVGLESLRAIREMAGDVGLNADDLQDIFCDNAMRLLGFLPETASRTQDLYRHAKERIPGGVQLLSKRPEMLAPDQWPAYFREARGCETWDVDGKHYYDFSYCALGACLLGYRDPDVTRAVQRRISLGSMCTLNAPEEVELADRLCQIHPWAEQARFARCGGEIGAVAARIARATTDRSLIAICGYHGWQDWYLAANLGESESLRGHLLPGLDPLGVPRELRGTAVTFAYNDREAWERILKAHGDRLAAVVMETCRGADPAPGFLQSVRDGAHKVGALLIFDEISIGWRLHFGGAHLKFGVAPDLAIFAKALGNGHPVAAVIGTRQAMQGAHDSFISSTYWTESVGPAAALATLDKMGRIDVPAHVARIGGQVEDLWQKHGEQYGLPVKTHEGYPCLAHFRFDHPQATELRTLYTQLMLERGFLAGISFYPMLAHTDEHVALYGQAIAEVFAEIADALKAGDVAARLKGPAAHTGFRRLVS
jgi:glutamate-1-semialdehyde 2,1-aminomutase